MRRIGLLLTLTCLGAAPLPDCTGAVPFVYDDVRVWLKATVGGREVAGDFILDTGAANVVLDHALVRQLGLAARADGSAGGAGAGRSRQWRLGEEALSLGAFQLRAAPLSLDLAPLLDAVSGHHVAGIVGAPLFERCAVTLDFAANRLVLGDAPEAGAIAEPIEVSSGVPFARVVLTLPDGREVAMRALVDLGAKATLLVGEDFAAREHLAAALLSCPRLSGPSTMIVWTTKGTTNAEQEAQAGRDHREAA
jgi:hypothetical protein